MWTEVWCNGSTTDFGSASLCSNHSTSTILYLSNEGEIFFLDMTTNVLDLVLAVERYIKKGYREGYTQALYDVLECGQPEEVIWHSCNTQGPLKDAYENKGCNKGNSILIRAATTIRSAGMRYFIITGSIIKGKDGLYKLFCPLLQDLSIFLNQGCIYYSWTIAPEILKPKR